MSISTALASHLHLTAFVAAQVGPAYRAKILAPAPTGDGINYTGMCAYQMNNTCYSDSFSGTEHDGPDHEITVEDNPGLPGSTMTTPGEMGFLGIVGILFGVFCVGGVGWDMVKAKVTHR